MHNACQAMDLIVETAQWGANVVYGDTDSVFVSLPGRTREEAFRIGNEIATAVNALNPRPIRLKFEKVRKMGLISHQMR